MIQPSKFLEPYFKIGAEIAKTSPCIRRQYGAVIVRSGPTISFITGTNERVGRCCRGNTCARSELRILHGQRVEVGGEIHAETAALIKAGTYVPGSYFVLTGFIGDKEIVGKDVWPCHSCAMQILFAGYRYIFTKNAKGYIAPISVAGIIEEHEEEWWNESGNH